MHLLGFIASALIGISLGLIGGGGSILTIPVLVYLFDMQPSVATSYSLFIVGITGLVGTVTNYTKKLVNCKVALLFGISSIITVFGTRKYLIPLIPEHITTIGGKNISFSWVIMLLFAILMIIASISMIQPATIKDHKMIKEKHAIFLSLIGYGVGIGLVTGLLGAGGGFLIIPVLVLLIDLSMKEAIGTSLMIIAMNSLIGFTGDIGHFKINWTLLLIITAIAVAGFYAGTTLGQQIQGGKLKKVFGYFILLMAIYIIIKEIIGIL